MTIREGRWRCPRCQSENLGRFAECRSCGDTRDDGVQFYLPEGEPEVSDEQLLALATAGADLLCEHCDTANRPDAERCEQCGAPLGERRRRQVVTPAAPKAEEIPVAPASPAPRTQPVATRRGQRLSRGRKAGCLGCLGAVVLLLGGLLAGTLYRKEVRLTVSHVSWQRSIGVEELVTLTRTGWQDELPAGARPRSRQQAVRGHRQVQVGSEQVRKTESYQVQVGTEKVKVGTRDLGNGFFEDVYEERPVYETRTREVEETRPVYRQEPVHGIEVTYEIDEWQPAGTVEASGDEEQLYWPEVEAGPRRREQAGSRHETCRVVLRERGGKSHPRKVPCATLGRYPPGSRQVAEVDLFGTIHRLRPAGR